MQTYKKQFIEFMVRCDVLRFGDFVTKSGRRTPFFINTGNFDTGERLRRLGEFYAAAIESQLTGGYDLLYGPAYKGIPLATATAAALAANHGIDVPVLYNRKEAKDHGEGGRLIGRTPQAGDRVLIIDDVVTAGTSVRESAAILREAAPVQLAGLAVSVDRQERGSGTRSALAEVAAEYGLHAFAIVTLAEIVDWLHNRPIDGSVVLDDAMLERITYYLRQYVADA